ncbi:hypothetical protein BZG36_05573, partial [Bifiguratus adelaidae]
MLKEISSDGNIQTVDVVYPSSPIHYYLNGDLIRWILNPLVDYMASGLWPQTYACHDLGPSYPNANGHNDGGGELMPVEESANMLLMIGMYLQNPSNPSDAKSWASSHYSLFKQWPDYLVGNALYPANQLTTDDFAGPIANASNLALKGILAIGEMGRIANLVGQQTDAYHYTSTAGSYIQTWNQVSMDPSGQYLNLAYGDSGSWSLKYNAFPDKPLGLNLIPTVTINLEDAKSRSVENAYSVPLDIRHTYTKGDWEMWTAASSNDPTLRQNIVDELYNFINTFHRLVRYRGRYPEWIPSASCGGFANFLSVDFNILRFTLNRVFRTMQFSLLVHDIPDLLGCTRIKVQFDFFEVLAERLGPCCPDLEAGQGTKPAIKKPGVAVQSVVGGKSGILRHETGDHAGGTAERESLGTQRRGPDLGTVKHTNSVPGHLPDKGFEIVHEDEADTGSATGLWVVVEEMDGNGAHDEEGDGCGGCRGNASETTAPFVDTPGTNDGGHES